MSTKPRELPDGSPCTVVHLALSHLSLFTRRLVPPLGVALATTVVFSMVRRGVMVSASAGAVLVRQHMGHLQAREMVKIWLFEIT